MNVLDAFFTANFSRKIQPLVDFLNISEVDHLRCEYQKSKEVSKEISLKEIINLHKELTNILEVLGAGEILDEILDEDRERIENLVNKKLKNIESHWAFLDTGFSHDIWADDAITQLWLDLTTDVLYYSSPIIEKIGKCLYCEKWFAKGRSDQKYCSDSCYNRAYYQKKKDRDMEKKEQENMKKKRMPTYSRNIF